MSSAAAPAFFFTVRIEGIMVGKKLWVSFVGDIYESGFLCRAYPVEATYTVDGREIVRASSGDYRDRTANHYDSEIEAKQAILAVLVQRIAKLEAQYDDLLQDVRRQRMEDNA